MVIPSVADATGRALSLGDQVMVILSRGIKATGYVTEITSRADTLHWQGLASPTVTVQTSKGLVEVPPYRISGAQPTTFSGA